MAKQKYRVRVCHANFEHCDIEVEADTPENACGLATAIAYDPVRIGPDDWIDDHTSAPFVSTLVAGEHDGARGLDIPEHYRAEDALPPHD